MDTNGPEQTCRNEEGDKTESTYETHPPDQVPRNKGVSRVDRHGFTEEANAWRMQSASYGMTVQWSLTTARMKIWNSDVTCTKENVPERFAV